MRWPPPLIPLLFLATVLVDLAVVEMADQQQMPAPAPVLLIALCFGQIALLALWMSLGSALWLVRLGTLAAGIVCWSLALNSSARDDSFFREILMVLSAEAAMIMIVGGFFALAGFQWTRAEADVDSRQPSSPRRRYQFSISQILGWTTLVALVATVFRIGELPSRFFSDMFFVLLAYVAISAFAIRTAIASRAFLGWLALSIAISVKLGFSLGLLASFKNDQYATVTIFVLSTLFLHGWLFICRLAGYPIVRAPRDMPGEETE